MAEADPLNTMLEVIDRVHRGLATVYDDTSAPARFARPLIQQFFTEADAFRAELADVAGRAAIVATDPRWAETERRRQLDEIITASRATVDQHLAAMSDLARQITEGLAGASTPRRPEPVDALQYAEIGARESRMRLVLDSLPADDVIDRLEQYLREAVLAGDQLGVWHLTSSGWADAVLEARGVAQRVVWSQRAAEIAEPALGPDALFAARLLAAVNAQYGLQAAIVAGRHAVRIRLDDVRRGVRS